MIKYKPLLNFMLKRHEIYLSRAAGKSPPWTRDPILQKYSFTNVYRELDRVTVWVRKSIREPYAEHPNLWFMLCFARQINWPPMLEELIRVGGWPLADRWRWQDTMRTMRARAARGEKVYTGAYILNAQGENRPEIAGHGRFDKPLFTSRLVLQSVWEARKKVEPAMSTTLQTATETLKQYFGWGGFTAYEVICDLRHTRYLRDATDKLTWAHAGPGALRGLFRLTGYLPAPRLAVQQMRALLEEMSPRWIPQPVLELREIEHSLCEFDKYERVRLGEGRPKALFKPQDEGRLP